jgi:hypothetical protein
MSFAEEVGLFVLARGGRWVHDKDGAYAELAQGEFVARLEPFDVPLQQTGIECAVEHRAFAELVNYILGEGADEFLCMKYFQVDRAQSEDVDQLIQRTLLLATAEPLVDYLARFKVERPDKPSIPQLCHLGALAWNGDYSTLLDYEAIFKTGKRLNFVPMITTEMIERALEKAWERAP